MKLIIPLTILIVSYLIYYLFYEPKEIKKGDFVDIEDIKVDAKYKNPNKRQNTDAPYIKPKEVIIKEAPVIIEPSIKEEKPEDNVIQKEYLTLEDLKKSTPHPKKEPMNRPFNYQVFLEVKKMLQQSSNTYYAKHSIVLNSYINSILINDEQRQRFKDLLVQQFGEDPQNIDEVFYKNKTVWDWVIYLAP